MTSLPEVPDSAPPPERWAREVRKHQPHGLDMVEARVLAWTGFTIRSLDGARHTLSIVWGVACLFLTAFASIAGFAIVFGNQRDIAIGRVDAPTADDIPFSSIAFAVGAVGVVCVIVRWLGTGRRRDKAMMYWCIVAVVFGLLSWPISAELAREGGVELGAALVPMFVMVGLAVVAIILMATSPPPDPEPEVAIEDLPEAAVEKLLELRREILEILVNRGLLTDVDIDELMKRPLGRLHMEEAHE